MTTALATSRATANEFWLRLSAQLIVKLLATVVGSPENAGTRAARKTRATQPPTAVPARSPLTMALVARPLGAKVTTTRPPPVGPPGTLQPDVEPAALASAVTAAALSKGGAPPVAGAGAGAALSAALLGAASLDFRSSRRASSFARDGSRSVSLGRLSVAAGAGSAALPAAGAGSALAVVTGVVAGGAAVVSAAGSLVEDDLPSSRSKMSARFHATSAAAPPANNKTTSTTMIQSELLFFAGGATRAGWAAGTISSGGATGSAGASVTGAVTSGAASAVENSAPPPTLINESGMFSRLGPAGARPPSKTASSDSLFGFGASL